MTLERIRWPKWFFGTLRGGYTRLKGKFAETFYRITVSRKTLCLAATFKGKHDILSSGINSVTAKHVMQILKIHSVLMQELMFLNKNYFQFVCQFQPCYVTQNTIKIDENKTPSQIFFITFYWTKMYTSYIFLSIEDSRFIKQAVITDSIRSSTLGCLDDSSF